MKKEYIKPMNDFLRYNLCFAVFSDNKEEFLDFLKEIYEIIEIKELTTKSENYSFYKGVLKEKVEFSKDFLENSLKKYNVLAFKIFFIKRKEIILTSFYSFNEDGVKIKKETLNERSLLKVETLLDSEVETFSIIY